MAVNLDGAFNTAQAAAKVFKSQGTGNIIFTTSMSAVIVNRPEPQAAVSFNIPQTFDFHKLTTPQYNASKAGLVHLAKSLAIEWVDFCRVNCISPGYIKTDMLANVPKDWLEKWLANSPGGRLGETHELKGVCLWARTNSVLFLIWSHC